MCDVRACCGVLSPPRLCGGLCMIVYIKDSMQIIVIETCSVLVGLTVRSRSLLRLALDDVHERVRQRHSPGAAAVLLYSELERVARVESGEREALGEAEQR